jgi:hypothetical protein
VLAHLKIDRITAARYDQFAESFLADPCSARYWLKLVHVALSNDLEEKGASTGGIWMTKKPQSIDKIQPKVTLKGKLYLCSDVKV